MTSLYTIRICSKAFWAKKRYAGFTLVELLVVIAILGTLSGIAIPAYNNYIEMAKNARAIVEIDMLQQQIDIFKEENGALPATLNDIGYGNLLDPWGNPYKYLNFATLEKATEKGESQKGKGGKGETEKVSMRKDRWEKPLNTYYDLYSMGRDGKSLPTLRAQASHDDIIRANDGRYIGLASEH